MIEEIRKKLLYTRTDTGVARERQGGIEIPGHRLNGAKKRGLKGTHLTWFVI